jgi:hypothetical protein
LRNYYKLAGRCRPALKSKLLAGQDTGLVKMKIEYAKVSALGDRTDNQDRAAVIVAEDAASM